MQRWEPRSLQYVGCAPFPVALLGCMDGRCHWSAFVWVVVIFEVIVDRFPGFMEGGVFGDTSPEVGKCCVWFKLEWVDQVAFANDCQDDVG